MAELLLSPDWRFALWAIMLGLVAFAFWAETTRLGRNISGVVMALGLAMLLSNVGIIPKSAPAYDVVWSYLVPLAIPLLLFKADLRQLIPETKGMLIAFMLGTVGTIIGTVLGVMLLPLGGDAGQLAGIFSATYIGGSMNMAAVAEAVEIDSALLTASVAADNVIGVLYLGLLALMPSIGLLRRWLPSPIIEEAERAADEAVVQKADPTDLNLLHISFALFLALGICSASYFLANLAGIGRFSILFVTALTVVVANTFPKQMKKLEGDYEIGMLFMYLFFIIVGAGADIAKMIDSAMVIVLFAAIIVICHMLMIFLGSRVFKLDLAEVIIASNACAAGPAPAAALAAGRP
jgi:uncharacterized membrane protein